MDTHLAPLTHSTPSVYKTKHRYLPLSAATKWQPPTARPTHYAQHMHHTHSTAFHAQYTTPSYTQLTQTISLQKWHKMYRDGEKVLVFPSCLVGF